MTHIDPMPTWYFDVPMNISITVVEHHYAVAWNHHACLSGECNPLIYHRNMGFLNPNSRGHTEAWDSLDPTQGATPKHGSPSPQLKGHTKAWCGRLGLGGWVGW